MQDPPKAAVWSIPSLNQNFIAYRSSKGSSRPDCIFEINQVWQSDFSRVHSNSCCSCSFEPEIIKNGQSSQTVYSNNLVNFQVSTIILNACTKTVWKLIECTTYTNTHRHTHTPKQTYMHIYHIYCLLGFVCDHLSSSAIPFSPPPFFKGFMHQQMTFPACQNCHKFYHRLDIVGCFGSYKCHNAEQQIGHVCAYGF